MTDHFDPFAFQGGADTVPDYQGAIDADDAFDDGTNVPVLFLKSAALPYLCRVWPNMPHHATGHPGDPVTWWFKERVYSWTPKGLARGCSPTMERHGRIDTFDAWLTSNVSYDSQRDEIKAFYRLRPRQRCLINMIIHGQLRMHAGQRALIAIPEIAVENIHCLSFPWGKGGWDVIKERVSQFANEYGFDPVHLQHGCDLKLSLSGEKINKAVTQWDWEASRRGYAFRDAAWTKYLYENKYTPLAHVYKALTENELQAYIDYYKPIVEAFLQRPDLFKMLDGRQGYNDPKAIEIAKQVLGGMGGDTPLSAPVPGINMQIGTAPAQQATPTPAGGPPPFSPTLPPSPGVPGMGAGYGQQPPPPPPPAGATANSYTPPPPPPGAPQQQQQQQQTPPPPPTNTSLPKPPPPPPGAVQ